MEILFIIGRILLGGFFVYNGVGHFLKLNMLAGYAKSKKVPFSKLAVAFTGLMLVVGGLAVILNISAIAGLWILLIFMVLTTFAMHQFWGLEDPTHRMNDQIQFSKNIAIIGALLILLS
jgi:putative oxidoreductase